MWWLLVSLNVLVHIIVPLILLAGVARYRPGDRLSYLLYALLTLVVLVYLWLDGAGWVWFGPFWPWIYFLFYVAFFLKGLSFNWIGKPWIPGKRIKPWIWISVSAFTLLNIGMALPELVSTRKFSGQPLELSFPLKDGTFIVVNGGSREISNLHHGVHAQMYALDVTKINDMGFRARGLLPADLNRYLIFGTEIFSPCEGEVLEAFDGLADLTPPQADPKSLAGNHVIIFCKEHSVLLAHMQKGSVAVHTGDHVTTGQLLGRVGNTGNTSEPHLHIHAVEGRHFVLDEIDFKAEPTPLLFNNRFLVRNDQF
jgi:hypothetical protein